MADPKVVTELTDNAHGMTVCNIDGMSTYKK